MHLIAHRGNIDGANHESENNPEYILKAINSGFDCEIDLWLIGKDLLLGHDEPQYRIEETFLHDYKNKFWVHCKNLAALEFITTRSGELNGFWHQNDDFTLTTRGYIWTYPNKPMGSNSVIVNLGPKNDEFNFPQIAGICSDFISSY